MLSRIMARTRYARLVRWVESADQRDVSHIWTPVGVSHFIEWRETRRTRAGDSPYYLL
jgi:hypothetical protein